MSLVPKEDEVRIRHVTRVNLVTDYIVPRHLFEAGKDVAREYLEDDDSIYQSYFIDHEHEDYWQVEVDGEITEHSPRIWEY